MKLLFSAILFFVYFSGNGFCVVSEAKVQKAIDVLLEKPFSPAGRDAGKVILEFVGTSPDYCVEINLGYLPWSGDRDLPRGSQMLLAAFVAGNLRAQIQKGSSQPDPYAGALAVIRVYRELSKQVPDFKIPKVEEFISMERRGVLRSYVASVR